MIEFNRILCPVDFSESSTRALAHAAALARWYEAQLTVLHVVPTFDPMQVRAELGVPVEIVNPMTPEEVVGSMRPFLERAGVSPEAHLVAEAGDASGARARPPPPHSDRAPTGESSGYTEADCALQ